MARLLVVSRDSTLADTLSAGLTTGSHEVLHLRPTAFDAWVVDARDQHLDGVVLDVGDPDVALGAVTELRARAQMAPVLVVPGEEAGWGDARMRELPAAAVLPLPMTDALLLVAVEQLVARGTHSFVSSTVPATTTPAADGLVRRREPHRLGPPSDGALTPANGVERTTDVAPPTATAPNAPLTAQPWPDAPDATRGARLVRVGPPSGRPTGAAATPAELVRALLRAERELYGLAETADAVVLDAVERVGAEAGAVLLPDGSRWRVAAGHGLRALEHRFELTAEDWLVVEVARGGHAVVMEDTDVVRQPLRGSPLASWHHLLATPVPAVDGVLLVARSADPAFGRADVETLADLAREAAPLVEDALQVRELARRLARHRDSDDPRPQGP